MLYKQNPFTGYFIALAAGIICGNCLSLPVLYNSGFLLAFMSLTCMAIIYSQKKNVPAQFGIAVHLCIFLFGCSIVELQSTDTLELDTKNSKFILRTDTYPADRSRSLMMHTSAISVNNAEPGGRNKFILYSNSKTIPSDVQPGNIIQLSTSPVEISDYNTEDNFDYRRFMNRRGFRYILFCYDSIKIIGDKPSLKHHGLRIRKKLLQILDNNIRDQESLSIVSAMMLGYRDMLGEELKNKFRGSGVVHIMAVSGLHVGIISLIIFSILRMSGIRSGIFQLIISLSAIWLYALITGLSPSVTRASVMFSFLGIGYFINRPASSLNSVMASAFLILLVNPLMLFEASFLLSYSAVITIILFYKNISGSVSFTGRILDFFWKIIVVSILAQLGTLPFVMLFFGEVPLFSIISNLFAIPLATVLLSAGFILITFSWMPAIPELAIIVINSSVNILTDMTAMISSFDKSVISTGNISAGKAVSLFILITLLLRHIVSSERNNPHILLFTSILFVLMP